MICMNTDFPHYLVVRQGPFRLQEAESQPSKTVYRLYGKCITDLQKLFINQLKAIDYNKAMRCLKVRNIAQEVVEDE